MALRTIAENRIPFKRVGVGDCMAMAMGKSGDGRGVMLFGESIIDPNGCGLTSNAPPESRARRAGGKRGMRCCSPTAAARREHSRWRVIYAAKHALALIACSIRKKCGAAQRSVPTYELTPLAGPTNEPTGPHSPSRGSLHAAQPKQRRPAHAEARLLACNSMGGALRRMQWNAHEC